MVKDSKHIPEQVPYTAGQQKEAGKPFFHHYNSLATLPLQEQF